MMKVNEIFYSLQGESSFAGWPCIFIRLTGCNLHCSWCDTEYAYEEGADMSIQSIVDEVKKYPCNLVEITGGEPLLQDEITVLVEALAMKGKTILVETNGSQDIRKVNPQSCIRILDLKGPSSGHKDDMDWMNLGRLSERDEIKFVIADHLDYVWAKDVVQKHHLTDQHIVLFSPVSVQCDPKDLAQWILDDGLSVRLQLQLHKTIWQDERGR